MRLDAMERPSATQLLRHPLFTSDNFGEDFSRELRKKIDKEKSDNNNLYKILKGERDVKKSFAAKFQVCLFFKSSGILIILVVFSLNSKRMREKVKTAIITTVTQTQ